MAEREDVSINELGTTLANGLKEADQQRTAGLEMLVELRLARAEGRRRERVQRANMREDDPRLATLDARIAEDAEIATGLYLEALRSTAPRVEPEDGVWQLYGRLIPQGRGLPRGAVALLIGRNGRPLSSVEAAALDRRGFFLIRYPIPAETKDGGLVKTRGRAVSEQPSGTQPSPVILKIVDGAGEEVTRHPEPFQPAAGRVAYIEIPLVAETRREPPPDRKEQARTRRATKAESRGRSGRSGSTDRD